MERIQAHKPAGRTPKTWFEIGAVPVPAKYRHADFRKTTYWQLRGKLDVPKERFILYPGCERRQAPSPVIGWAGWDHLEHAQPSPAPDPHASGGRLGRERLTPSSPAWRSSFPGCSSGTTSTTRRSADGSATPTQTSSRPAHRARAHGRRLAAWRPPQPTRGRRRKGAPRVTTPLRDLISIPDASTRATSSSDSARA